jgi:hypothetical protein
MAYVAGLLRRRMLEINSPGRLLPAGRITLLVLAMLRHDQRASDLAGGNRVSKTTMRRRRDEIIALPAAKAPRLGLREIANRGGEVVLINARSRRGSGHHFGLCVDRHAALPGGRAVRVSAGVQQPGSSPPRGRDPDIKSPVLSALLGHRGQRGSESGAVLAARRHQFPEGADELRSRVAVDSVTSARRSFDCGSSPRPTTSRPCRRQGLRRLHE